MTDRPESSVESHFRIRPLTERSIDSVIERAGGCRAHLDADRRTDRGADYVLDDWVIELKLLDEQGLSKSSRQEKLAGLFHPLFPDRPVIVLDRELLGEADQRRFDRILEGPIKTAVGSAKGQLKQTRRERLDARASVLWVINNGYTALSHKSLARLVARRARNDTQEIDGVIVSGCYFHSDSFDSFFLWPIDYEPINVRASTTIFEKLRAAWNEFADERMTELVRNPPSERETVGPVVDVQFDVEGVTYVSPAPPIGGESDYFLNGRPRSNENAPVPMVATVVGDITRAEWTLFREADADASWLGDDYEEWLLLRADVPSSTVKPAVGIPVSFHDWAAWSETIEDPLGRTVHHLACERFNSQMRALLESTRDLATTCVRPSRWVRVVTEVIGQDAANDVSHADVVIELESGKTQSSALFSNQRLPFEHALALACAYAIQEEVQIVFWQKGKRYAWC